MIGHEPQKETVVLTADADLYQVIRIGGIELPTGTTARLAFYATSDTEAPELLNLPGVVTVDSITFRSESTVVDAVPNRTRFRVYVSYPETPTLEDCWFVGAVKRIQ